MVSIRYGPQGYPVALGARIIRANGRQALVNGTGSDDFFPLS